MIKYFVEYCDGEVEEITREEMIAKISRDCKYSEEVVVLLEKGGLPEISMRQGRYFVKKYSIKSLLENYFHASGMEKEREC